MFIRRKTFLSGFHPSEHRIGVTGSRAEIHRSPATEPPIHSLQAFRSDNASHHYGAEGPTDDAARDRQLQNMLATLLLSQGAPMLLAGDEFAHTRNGNNNAYCQDNEISWLNWNMENKGQSLTKFVQTATCSVSECCLTAAPRQAASASAAPK